ncbi:MAG: ABC transporter substrate-binding protein [Xanthobacteraceae bacterium]
MRRRKFITLLGSAAAAWPIAARTQEPTRPIVGFLSSASTQASSDRLKAFLKGLAEVGFVEGGNVSVKFRSAEGRYERLPALAAELVHIPVAVIAASGITATRAAKASTPTIPIVFNTGGDPISLGLVASLNRPGGNLTGVATLGKVLVGKQLELLHEFVAKSAPFGFLVNPSNAVAQVEIHDALAAAGTLGRKVILGEAPSEHDFDAAFISLARGGAGAVLIQADPYFQSRRDQLVALAARHAMPAISPYLDYAGAGGLFSYGSSLGDAMRLVGNYAGRILKGERPADLPVQQAVKVELIINLKTARALGLTLPSAILLRADEVIE